MQNNSPPPVFTSVVLKKTYMYKICFSLLLLLFSLNVSAQFTLSGTLKDGETGEDLIGARILVDEMPGTGAITNVYGFFSLTFKEPGTYNLTSKSIGFETQNVEVVMDKSQTPPLPRAPYQPMLLLHLPGPALQGEAP